MKYEYAVSSKGLTLYPGPFDQMLNEPNGEVGDYLRRIGLEIVAAARAQVGVETGRLRDSIHMIHDRATSGQYIRVGSDVDYAYLHHEGSSPHTMPRAGHNVMRFSKGGRVIYSHNVQHPGTRPNRFLSDQLRLVQR